MTIADYRPTKLTREQQRQLKQRNKDFDAALKSEARLSKWGYAGGSVFCQREDWFINATAGLSWEHGVGLDIGIKPMELDPLFWDIVGLGENRALPLSFRANGAWVLRPATSRARFGADVSDVGALAALAMAEIDRWAGELVASTSITTMLNALPKGEDLRGPPRALAVCLNLLNNDPDRAQQLCRTDDSDAHPLVREGGGFSTHNPDGSVSTFLDQAREWIAHKRRSDMHTV